MRKINNHETSYNRLSNSNRLIEQDKTVSLYHPIAKRFYNYYFAYLAANKTQKKKKSIAIIYQFRGLKTYKAVVAV